VELYLCGMVLAMTMLCPSVTSQSSINTAVWTELVLGTETPFDLTYTVTRKYVTVLPFGFAFSALTLLVG